MPIRLEDLVPPGLTGWVDEVLLGRPLDDAEEPGSVRLKIAVGPDGVKLFALSTDEAAARQVLAALGFDPQCIRREICG
jgi:hypothetical protein